MNEGAGQPRPGQDGWQGVRWEGGKPLPQSQAAMQGSQAPDSQRPEPDTLTRFLGGSPGAVLMRLLVMSLVVGAILVWLDIQPYEIFRAFERFFQRLWLMGFDALREIASYIVAGAIIVVPIWLVMRIFGARGR